MVPSVAEIESIVADLLDQYRSLSREYSETQDKERKVEISDVLASIEYQIARFEEHRMELLNQQLRAAGA